MKIPNFKYDVEWLQDVLPNQMSDFFYCEGYGHSPVCHITGNGKKVLISCDGEMKLRYNDRTGKEHIITELWDFMDLGIETDKDYNNNLARFEWDYNPWFTAYDVTHNYDPTLGEDTYDHLDFVEGNLLDIIDQVVKYIETGEVND
jgi:hypothetical protein